MEANDGIGSKEEEGGSQVGGKLHDYSQTFIMLYALVQLPISSFCKLPGS